VIDKALAAVHGHARFYFIRTVEAPNQKFCCSSGNAEKSSVSCSLNSWGVGQQCGISFGCEAGDLRKEAHQDGGTADVTVLTEGSFWIR